VKVRYIVIAAIIIVGIVAVRHFARTEEKKVQKQFALLSEWATKEADESIITTSYKIQHITTLFADPCSVKADLISFTGSYTPEEISGFAGRSRFHFSHLSLKFYDLDIAFLDKGTARVTLTATVTGESKSGEHVDATHELKTVLTKAEDEWLFSYFEIVEVLQK
jgi:hypothetical protein